MNTLPNPSFQRFEDYKDNPMVQALAEFITSTLARRLDEVKKSWYIECSESSYREFRVRFTDELEVRGTIKQVLIGTPESGWAVHSFQYIFTVSGNIPTITFMTKPE